jgi:hypothetical protein
MCILHPTKNIQTLLCFLFALLMMQQGFSTVSRDECIRGSGCIEGATSGRATFEFSANIEVEPLLQSGSFSYTDSSAGISVSSDDIIDYGLGSTDSERILSFRLTGSAYSEARLFLSDSGPVASDSFRIQLLDSASVPVVENSGALLEVCGGGITISTNCNPPVPCELLVTVACAVVQAPTNSPSGGECTVSGAEAEVDFYYTIKNTGTAEILFSSLSGTDAFGELDLRSLGDGGLEPGEEITLRTRELVSGPFPFVNTVTITSERNGVMCSDMATLRIRKAQTPPEPGEVCDDFVTGGGWIVGTPSGGKANFGVHGGIRNGRLWGGLNYIDHKDRLHVK